MNDKRIGDYKDLIVWKRSMEFEMKDIESTIQLGDEVAKMLNAIISKILIH